MEDSRLVGTPMSIPLLKDAFLYLRGKLGVIPLSKAHSIKFTRGHSPI